MKTMQEVIEGLTELVQDFQDGADINRSRFERACEHSNMEEMVARRSRIDVYTRCAEDLMHFVNSITEEDNNELH